KKLNGIHIAGFVALELEKAVYPKTVIPILEKLNYVIDVDSSLAHKQSKDIFFDELFRVLEIRKKTFDIFWNHNKWHNFMAIITGSDRIGHFFWDIYENRNDVHHHRFLDYFHEIDAIIGDFKNKLKENDRLLILSDHGMELIKRNVNLNTYLEKEGLLYLTEKGKRYNRIEYKTKAFVLDPGRIYLNKKGLYPNGSVAKSEENEVINTLKNILLDLKFKNQNVIKKVYEKEEIYAGKMIQNAPDLVLTENKGFNLKASIGKDKIFEKEVTFSGKHNENSFLLLNKNNINLKQPSVENIVGLLG
ncbi:MAG: alkaline phosphatase family protein, partial [Candidatus Hermodarchaeota archaeon]